MSEDEEAIARAELAMHLRRQNVASRATLAALEGVPRSLFLGARHKRLAYQDRAAPIDCGQTISQPTIVAMMTDALELRPDMTVLEIGTGSGYQAAILARIAAHVFTVERYHMLSELAAERLRVLRIDNVSFKVGDGHDGWDEHAPFDRIIMTAAAVAVPEALVSQLAPGGILVAPIGDQGHTQELLKCRLTADGLEGERIADVRFVPLVPGVAGVL
ncbi:protein-L-isoaspartate(D-aspartate) O-methyltransferase [Acuticoccus sp. M5D2P5]|uniref:protein-L-isoaspartate(D-aspartate) O-methyltransferase n=1 Tax=Acuticoccus kalidii TaxID=2910977 RepID=UPI001F3615D2|nr:protein-L-isoaspartate(D-aspartate) O-methyltransferase [Acuticoccus kalidii]MCF3933054.1 protein-L-isoaspartate(D-aspartate) O-methyltransferase [Acuticoccus kalidii]